MQGCLERVLDLGEGDVFAVAGPVMHTHAHTQRMSIMGVATTKEKTQMAGVGKRWQDQKRSGGGEGGCFLGGYVQVSLIRECVQSGTWTAVFNVALDVCVVVICNGRCLGLLVGVASGKQCFDDVGQG